MIKFKSKDGNKHSFYYNWNILPDFCAWDQCYSFGMDHDWYNDWGDEDEDKAVAESRLFRTILERDFVGTKEERSNSWWKNRAGTHIFMGDLEGGFADKHLFPYVPKKPFIIGDVRFKPKLSDYYLNPNSGNMCRHLIMETELVKPKAKATKPKKEKAV